MKKQILATKKGNKGITLIALVITIIVLLILAAVSIAILTGENGLLTRAGDAKEETRGASVQEAIDLWKINKSVDNYIGDKTAQSKTVLLDDLENKGLLINDERNRLEAGETITIGSKQISLGEEKSLSDQLKVGDYVNYGVKLTVQTYSTDTSETGYNSSQTFQTNKDMLWRVINKKTNGDVEIVAVSNTLATDGNTGLYLKGQAGFLNAETVLKNLCDKLYTNTEYGTAESIDVDDINGLTGYNPEASNSMIYKSGGPFWDKSSNTFKKPSSANPITVEEINYSYPVDEKIPLYDTLIAESKTYDGDYSETNYPKFYWLGSRCAVATTGYADMYVCIVGGGEVTTSHLFGSNTAGGTLIGENACAIRPIVTLKSTVQIDNSDSSKDGSSEAKAWELK